VPGASCTASGLTGCDGARFPSGGTGVVLRLEGRFFVFLVFFAFFVFFMACPFVRAT
jgi:hypothetical protein